MIIDLAATVSLRNSSRALLNIQAQAPDSRLQGT